MVLLLRRMMTRHLLTHLLIQRIQNNSRRHTRAVNYLHQAEIVWHETVSILGASGTEQKWHFEVKLMLLDAQRFAYGIMSKSQERRVAAHLMCQRNQRDVILMCRLSSHIFVSVAAALQLFFADSFKRPCRIVLLQLVAKASCVTSDSLCVMS